MERRVTGDFRGSSCSGLPGQPGVTVEGGQLVIRGNAGEPNALQIDGNTITSSNGGAALPFQFTQAADATGGGVSARAIRFGWRSLA